jgi:probable HAF family extracellular repeat protein
MSLRWQGRTASVCSALFAAAALAGGVASAQAPAAIPSYKAIDLGALGPEPARVLSAATAINNAGWVVGWSGSPTGIHALLWRDGTVLDLGTPAGAQHSKATAINDTGQVVGYAYSIDERLDARAFIWQDGSFRDLGALASSDTTVRASAINNLGQVVGYSGTDQSGHAFLWQDGRMRLLSAGNSAAYGINDAGQVIGLDGTQSVLWQSGATTVLPLGARGSRPNALNARGQVVGVGVTQFGSQSCWCGALWDPSVTGLTYLTHEAWSPSAIND